MNAAGEGRERSAVERVLCRAEDLLHLVGCLCLVVVVLLIVADTVMRVGFGHPLQMQFELTELYLMPALATLSLSRVFRQRAHLSLEILLPSSFGRAWPAVNAAVLGISTLFFALLTWESGRYAAAAFRRDDVYMGVYDWPLGLAYLAIPVGCGLLTLRLLYEAATPTTTRRNDG